MMILSINLKKKHPFSIRCFQISWTEQRTEPNIDLKITTNILVGLIMLTFIKICTLSNTELSIKSIPTS